MKRNTPPRRLYLVLLGYLDRYEMGAPECPTRANVPDEEVLKLFGETNYPAKNQRFEIPVHHTNREKLIKLGAGDYATQIQTRLDAVQSHIQSTLASQKSKLSQKLKKKKR